MKHEKPRLRGAFGHILLRRTSQKTVQAGAANAQHPRSAHTISMAEIEYPLDVHTAYFIERQWLPGRIRCSEATRRLLQTQRQVAHIQEISARRDSGVGNHVFKLPDIPRPIVLQQRDLRPPRQPLKRLRVGLAVFLQKMLH
jgi:hypothetical protein